MCFFTQDVLALLDLAYTGGQGSDSEGEDMEEDKRDDEVMGTQGILEGIFRKVLQDQNHGLLVCSFIVPQSHFLCLTNCLLNN